MIMETNIYSLSHPVTGDIRYVGKTIKSLNIRLQCHIASSGYYKHRHVCNWINKLKSEGFKPEIRLLEVVHSDCDWIARERFWIAELKRQGCNLTNNSIGGEGGSGRITSEETRKKIGLAHKGKVISESQKAKFSAAMTGRKHSEEHKRKVSIAGKGRLHSEETKQRMSRTQKLRPVGLFAGERNGRSKLCVEQVKSIRTSSETYAFLSLKYGVTETTISDIKKGKLWKSIPWETV